jgi:hypothetical protein
MAILSACSSKVCQARNLYISPWWSAIEHHNANVKVSLVCCSTCGTGEGIAAARSATNKNAASVHSQVLDNVRLESTIKKCMQDTPGA